MKTRPGLLLQVPLLVPLVLLSLAPSKYKMYRGNLMLLVQLLRLSLAIWLPHVGFRSLLPAAIQGRIAAAKEAHAHLNGLGTGLAIWAVAKVGARAVLLRHG